MKPLHRVATGIAGAGRLVSGQSGAAVSEYAVILGGIAGGILLVAGLGLVIRETFARIGKGNDAIAAERAGEAVSFWGETRGGNRRSLWFPTSSGDGAALFAKGTVAAFAAAGGLVIVLGAPFLLALRKGCPFRRTTSPGAGAVEAVPLAHEQLLFQKRNVLRRVLLRRMDDERGPQAGIVRVRDVMTEDPVQVGPAEPVPPIAELMRARKIRHVLVVDRTGRVLGVISDRDICRPRGKTAREVMSQPPITVSPEAEIIPAVTILLQRRISCLPVVHDEKVRGILTVTDVLIAFQALIHSLGRIESLTVTETEDALLRTS